MHAQFQNIIVETRHEILLDHACKSIEITTRGSWSLEDCVIDAIPDHMSLEKVASCECSSNFMNNNKQYCYSGEQTRTMWMHNLQKNILQHVIE